MAARQGQHLVQCDVLEEFLRCSRFRGRPAVPFIGDEGQHGQVLRVGGTPKRRRVVADSPGFIRHRRIAEAPQHHGAHPLQLFIRIGMAVRIEDPRSHRGSHADQPRGGQELHPVDAGLRFRHRVVSGLGDGGVNAHHRGHLRAVPVGVVQQVKPGDGVAGKDVRLAELEL